MAGKLYIRLDADSIGDSIELALINGKPQEAQSIHNLVQKGIRDLIEKIESEPGALLLLVGCDDVLYSISDSSDYLTFLEKISVEFNADTNFTLSIGVGITLVSALTNLRRAKLLGKNRIIDHKYCEI